MLNTTEQFKALSSGLFQGGSMKLSGGTIEWPLDGPPESRRSPLRVEGFGAPSPEILKFETQFGAIWCILARN